MKKILFVFAVLCSSVLLAQDVFYFTSGLASGKTHQYGREAMYSDALAYSLYKGESKPQVGLPVSSGANTNWTSIKADSAHNFRSQALANGYLYLQYNAAKAGTAVFIGTGHSMVFINGAPHAGDMYRYGWMYIPITRVRDRTTRSRISAPTVSTCFTFFSITASGGRGATA